ncbi:MAG: hypothetical protein LBP86_02740 [Azoarcus sp.]|nr:hypothetical protein [Azoarcus sp.]
MAYVLEPMTNDDLPKISADAKTNPEVNEAIQKECHDGVPPYGKWAIDRDNASYLFWFCEMGAARVCRRGYLFFYRGKAFAVYMCTRGCVYEEDSHVPGGMRGWVSLARDFNTPPPQEPDFQRAFSEAYDVLWGRRPMVRPVFSVDARPYPYVLEPMTRDDPPRILADAKTDPKIDPAIQREFRNEIGSYHRWAIDRKNDSYLFHLSELSNPKTHLSGYLFFYRGKVFGVYMYMSDHVFDETCHAPQGMAGWVSLTWDFSAPPPQDLDFQRAFSEACDVLREGRLLSRVLFSVDQPDKELLTG